MRVQFSRFILGGLGGVSIVAGSLNPIGLGQASLYQSLILGFMGGAFLTIAMTARAISSDASDEESK